MKKDFNKIILECYVELYKHSTPSADFIDLMDKAERNNLGQKVIDYNSYEISINDFTKILNDVSKKYKLNPLHRRQFNNTITLGCSPKFKKESNE